MKDVDPSAQTNAAEFVAQNGDELPILNISCYKFVTLADAPALRDRLFERAQADDLKGTILIAEEGINFFLAGTAQRVRDYIDFMREDARLADLTPKESWSADIPFKRLKVKVKNEIIRMNYPTIRPDTAERAPALPPEVLERWLHEGVDDEGRPVVMLDTRNGFEVDFGGFRNAIDWRITKFTEFPDEFRAHLDEFKDKTIVSYCTGGIRCEKAALFMREAGHERVWQLDGGILKYLELTPGAHYDGKCFVFDEREAVDASTLPRHLLAES